ncbi:baseplate protein J [Nodosilinea sp. FACHB-131]|uniref:baseplate protein J n=1 Tax=Cyanophyceae TaxID=3028117 RepID=UPI00168A3021|nr:baseplate protein J [Nodosilinea sp. FACHB-131]MBD1873794.1 baseplate protein J [Nodosilinea sp. FACHB-131]
MTLPLPNLDDRTYADLVAEARSHIILEYPDWTDHNPSDPGIVVIELLAWLAELALYRVNQLPDANTVAYLKLLRGKDIDGSLQDNPAALQREIRQALTDLRQTYRAVTPADFATLIEQWNQTQTDPALQVKRVHCLPGCNLDRPPAKTRDDSAHISLVVLPDTAAAQPQPSPDLMAQLHQWFAPRQLLTVHHHIVGPQYVPIQPSASLYLEAGADPVRVRDQAMTEVENFFHPLASNQYWGGDGWPFGRSVYSSELYALLDRIPGVDYVQAVRLDAGATAMDEIAIAPHALVSASLSPDSFTLMEPTGDEWRAI